MNRNSENQVTRVYQSSHNSGNKNQLAKKILKKGHYLNDTIRASASPGPASNSFIDSDLSNKQSVWLDKNNLKLKESKRSNRYTEVEEVQRKASKHNFPSPDKYLAHKNWFKESSLKSKGNQQMDRITFTEGCEFQAQLTIGPGAYEITGDMLKKGIRKS